MYKVVDTSVVRIQLPMGVGDVLDRALRHWNQRLDSAQIIEREGGETKVLLVIKEISTGELDENTSSSSM